MTVIITLTVAGSDTGPFSLYSNLDGFAIPFETGVSRASMVAGYTTSLVPDGTTTVRVKSVSVCTNFIDLAVTTTTTTSSTSSTSSTSTSTTTTTPVPTIILGSPSCRNNNCNDNAVCSVIYNITVLNAPVGAYITVTIDPPPSGATVAIIDNNPASGKLLYSEPDGLQSAVFFTLELRDSGGTILDTYSTSLAHQTFWPFLPLC